MESGLMRIIYIAFKILIIVIIIILFFILFQGQHKGGKKVAEKTIEETKPLLFAHLNKEFNFLNGKGSFNRRYVIYCFYFSSNNVCDSFLF